MSMRLVFAGVASEIWCVVLGQVVHLTWCCFRWARLLILAQRNMPPGGIYSAMLITGAYSSKTLTLASQLASSEPLVSFCCGVGTSAVRDIDPCYRCIPHAGHCFFSMTLAINFSLEQRRLRDFTRNQDRAVVGVSTTTQITQDTQSTPPKVEQGKSVESEYLLKEGLRDGREDVDDRPSAHVQSEHCERKPRAPHWRHVRTESASPRLVATFNTAHRHQSISTFPPSYVPSQPCSLT